AAEYTHGAPLAHRGPAPDSAAGTTTLGQQPFDDLTLGLFGPLGSAAGARRHHAGPDDGLDPAAGGLAGVLGVTFGAPADAVRAPGGTTSAVARAAGTVVAPADLRGLTTAFLQAAASAGATQAAEGTQDQGSAPPPVGTANTLTYHGNAARTGWN